MSKVAAIFDLDGTLSRRHIWTGLYTWYLPWRWWLDSLWCQRRRLLRKRNRFIGATT